MMLQRRLWSLLCDHYCRLEVSGWERLPAQTSLLVGVHSGGALTMDAWTLVAEWYRRFGDRRILRATARDVLMAAPGLGYYVRANGVLRASPEAVSGALAAGRDVIGWPGGEQDAMRNWRKPDQLALAGRRGFVRQAITSAVPLGVSLEILPTHIPLPAKIRTGLPDLIDVEHDPERASDVEYVDRICREVRAAIQAGMNRLAARRRFPVCG